VNGTADVVYCCAFSDTSSGREGFEPAGCAADAQWIVPPSAS